MHRERLRAGKGVGAAVLLLLTCGTADADTASDVLALTGSRTRCVWVQDRSPLNNDILAHGRRLKLMAFDTHDGQGERSVLTSVRNYAKPLISPRGDRIVYSDRLGRKVYVVNWDGSERRRVCDGFAMEVWADPADGAEWVYVCRRIGHVEAYRYESARRVKLDNPKQSELVWDKTQISPDNFQLSADGRRTSGVFPWPNGGFAELPNKSWHKLSRGCWASMAPDNSYRCWVFDGPHRNVYLFATDSRPIGEARKINVNKAPGFDGAEAFHPRWSNHVRFLTVSGPYKVDGPINRISGGGPEVEIYLGRFNEDFTDTDRWIRITNNNRGDFYPDVWIEDGEKSSSGAPMALDATPAQLPERWPSSTSGLIFVWENASTRNQIAEGSGKRLHTCQVEPRGRAKFGRYFDMLLAGGWFETVSSNQQLWNSPQQTNQLSVECVITRRDPEPNRDATILSISDAAGSAGFMLGQQRDRLVMQLHTSATDHVGGPFLELCRPGPNNSHHVIVTYAPGKLRCYLNGRQVFSSMAVKGDFRDWSGHRLTFGAEATNESGWTGRLEGVAIFNRVLGADEAQRNFQIHEARLTRRKPAEQLTVRAKRVELSAIPDPKSIAPYRRALVIHRYRVEQVLGGHFDDSGLLVAHWAILDGRVLPEARVAAGASVDLTLERFVDHAELTSERQLLDVEGIDLPLFYDVTERAGKRARSGSG